jgi:hypothetical protein
MAKAWLSTVDSNKPPPTTAELCKNFLRFVIDLLFTLKA